MAEHYGRGLLIGSRNARCPWALDFTGMYVTVTIVTLFFFRNFMLNYILCIHCLSCASSPLLLQLLVRKQCLILVCLWSMPVGAKMPVVPLRGSLRKFSHGRSYYFAVYTDIPLQKLHIFFNVCCRASHLGPNRRGEAVRPALGPTQLPLQWLPQVLCTG